MDSKTIEIQDIKWLLSELANALEAELGSGSIEVKENFYWHIPAERMCDMDTLPSDPDVGSFWDDIDFMKVALSDRKFPGLLLVENILPIVRHLAYCASKGDTEA